MKLKYSPLPAFFRSRWMLFWSTIFPQAILAVANLRSWGLVAGEVADEGVDKWVLVGAFQGALLLLQLGWFIVLQARRSEATWPVCIPAFLLHIGYLWTVVSVMEPMIPTSVRIWILPPQVFMFHQFALMMPAVFYLAFRLACLPMVKHPAADVGITLSTMIGLPLLWYLFVRMISLSHFSDGAEFVWVLCWVGATILAVMAFLRLMMMVYSWVHRIQSRRWILVLLAAFAMPLGGMALNVAIPFPVDLQFFSIYAFIALNAAALLIPRPASTTRLFWVWLARCATFAFTLYFFLLFLPFLPLALPAIFAAGAGFLIMAPTLLFAVHVRVLVDEGRQLAQRFGLWRTLALGLVALAIIPAGLCGDALLDRRSLMGALDAVYSPDTTKPANISAKRAARSLERLDAAKAGLYLPFVSGMYRKIVFDGLVLPDHKLAHMYQLFTGKELVHEQQHGFRGGILDLWTDFRGTRRGSRIARVPRTTRLTATAVSHSVSNGMVRATVQLTIENTGTGQAEFVTRMHLPVGVLVTGYWLDVDGTRKQGRIYEKRAAMWVYHMIRDMTRRDPGLLIFERPNRLKLNVFPVEKEPRITGIEFLLPVGLDAALTLDDEQLSLAPLDTTPMSVPITVDNGQADAVTVWPAQPADAPATTRRAPVVYLLFDRTYVARDATAEQWQAKYDEIAELLPEDVLVRVGGVNFGVSYLNEDPVPPAAARKLVADLDSIRPEGGLDPHQAVRRGVAAWQSAGVEATRSRVPVFVFVLAEATQRKPVGSLAGLETYVPDMPRYYVYSTRLSSYAFSSNNGATCRRVESPEPVAFVSNERADAFVPGQYFISSGMTGEGAAVSSPQYVQGMRMWERWRETVVNPSLLDPQYGELVAASRAASVLLPVTSFMVVENSAQEAILERKHKEGSKADVDVEFDEHQESPAPGILWLVVPLIGLEAWRRRRGRPYYAEASYYAKDSKAIALATEGPAQLTNARSASAL